MKNPETGKRLVALSAAVAIGFGGVALTGPAIATNDAPETLRAAGIEAFQAEGNDNVAAVGYNSNGEVAVQVVEDSGLEADDEALAPLAAFAKAETNSELDVQKIDGAYQAINATDVVGGAGYAVEAGQDENGNDLFGLCSFGFPATTEDGDEAIITAGHCSDEGKEVFLERPSTAEAHAGAGSQFSLLTGESIGTVTHSQFGPMTEADLPDNVADIPKGEAQDFAVITLSDEAIKTHGEVTDWTTAGDEDLFASTLDVTGVADVTEANVGDAIVRSGRTSGMHEGTVGELVDGYSFVSDDEEDYLVHGFATETLGLPGDSGGSVMLGDKAAGVASASNMSDSVWVAELHEGLEHLPKEYSIKTATDEEPSPEPTEDPTQEPTETPDPTPTATEDPTQEPTDTPEPTPTATETGEPTETPEPTPTPTDTDSPEPTPTDTDSPEPTPTDTDSPEPTPTDTDSPEPTETATDEPTTPAPTPSETEDADEDAELTVDPREIAAEQFLAEDEDQAIEQDRGVTYSVTGVEPGSDVTFDTYASTDSASANAGSEEAPAEDSDDAPAKSVTVTADEDGNASSRVWGLPTAPAEAYIGDYEVVVTTDEDTLEGSFEVVGEGGGDGGQDDSDEGDNGGDGDDLPRTGSTTAPLAAGAAGLVALGGALVYVARRRKA